MAQLFYSEKGSVRSLDCRITQCPTFSVVPTCSHTMTSSLDPAFSAWTSFWKKFVMHSSPKVWTTLRSSGVTWRHGSELEPRVSKAQRYQEHGYASWEWLVGRLFHSNCCSYRFLSSCSSLRISISSFGKWFARRFRCTGRSTVERWNILTCRTLNFS